MLFLNSKSIQKNFFIIQASNSTNRPKRNKKQSNISAITKPYLNLNYNTRKVPKTQLTFFVSLELKLHRAIQTMICY